MNISILGAGAWGTALAMALAARHDVLLWARDADAIDQCRHDHINQRYLPGIFLPDNLLYSAKLQDALTHAGQDGLIIVATSVSGLRELAGACMQSAVSGMVWLCKGLEQDSNLLPHEVVQQVLAENNRPSSFSVAVLSGPSFAQEVAHGLPCALVAASKDSEFSKRVRHVLHGGALRVYSSTDITGVEIGGAVKNVIAIATGIADGLELGMNARAALMTRGLAEMSRLALALGSEPATMMGLSGIGDLILTCTGALSRNRRVGLGLASGKRLDQIISELGHVAEGVRCAQAVVDLAAIHQIDMPISQAVVDVLFHDKAPSDMAQVLLARDSRFEADAFAG